MKLILTAAAMLLGLPRGAAWEWRSSPNCGYPGPSHVLGLADKLELKHDQISAVHDQKYFTI